MTTDLVPVSELKALSLADQEAGVTLYLTGARDRLALALEATGPEAVASLRAELATITEMTKQLHLSKEIQTDAQEMTRRAEFGLGKAIRRGQEAGEVETLAEARIRAVAIRDQSAVGTLIRKPRPLDYAKHHELSSSNGGIYDLVDGVTEEQFEDALSEARAEQNPSRANVIRKIRGQALRSERPEVLRNRRRLDSNRIVEQTVLTVEGIGSLFDQIDYTELDRAVMPEWVSSLSEAIRALRSLKTNIEKELNQ